MFIRMRYIVFAPRELTMVRMFCGGTSPGPVNAAGVCAIAETKYALASANKSAASLL